MAVSFQTDRLKKILGYAKFKTAPYRFIILDTGYHLVAEITRALQTLGHHCQPIQIDMAHEPKVSDVVRSLLHACVETRPDAVLAVNHLGFDEQGMIGTILEQVEMPIAIWYVDSPHFVLKHHGLPAKQVTSLFLWERGFMESMQKAGAEDIHYLPLAADPERIKPSFHCPPIPLTFVGDSMERAVNKWLHKIPAAQNRMARRYARELAANRKRNVAASLQGKIKQPKILWDTVAATTWLATQKYRNRVLAKVVDLDLCIYGDEGWKRTLPEAKYIGPLKYGSELGTIYSVSEITLNATSLQMPTAINQRVFDVPAVGGFLISDHQADIEEHFEIGKEAVTYQHPNELPDLVRFYRRRTSIRESIVQAAQAKVLAEHTYVHRVQTMLAALTTRHATRGTPVSSMHRKAS